MKNKYERLSRKEKKQAIVDFKNHSSKYKEAINKINRIKYISIAGFIFGILSFVFDIYFKNDIASFLLDACVVIFCLLSYKKCLNIINREVNHFLIQNKK